MWARNIDQLPHMPPTVDLACSPGTCPDQGPNWQLFSVWEDTHPTEPHQSGQHSLFLLIQESIFECNEVRMALSCGKPIQLWNKNPIIPTLSQAFLG